MEDRKGGKGEKREWGIEVLGLQGESWEWRGGKERRPRKGNPKE